MNKLQLITKAWINLTNVTVSENTTKSLNTIYMYCMAFFIQNSKFGKSRLLDDGALAKFGVDSVQNGVLG